MEVILLRDLKNIGRRGDVKNVSDGYARNFLLPHRVAARATPALKAAWQKEKAKAALETKRKATEMAALATKLKDLKILFVEKANEEGTLFSGVTKEKIVHQLQAVLSLPLETEHIFLPKPIKQVGEHVVEVVVEGKQYPINLEVKADE